IVELWSPGSDKAPPRSVTVPPHLPQLCPSPHFPSQLQRPPQATARGRTAADAMNDECSARQRAISLRLAGRPVKLLCSVPGRGEARFHKWWRRYLEVGPEGLYDRTRANHHVAQHLAPELERT